MNCSYCKKDMGDSDICPHCGMGRRIDYELFKSDKEERKKSFEDYEKDYLDRVKNGDKPKDTKPEPENNPAPDNWNKPTVPNSGSNKGMKIAIGLGIPLLLGIITGAIMAAGGGGGDVTYVYQPMQPQYGDFAYQP